MPTEKYFVTSIEFEDLFEAYYQCRKNKRNKTGAIHFELDLEKNVFELWQELCNGSWTPCPSTVFIVDKPVKREIFAASFRDRIVHHYLISCLNPLFEQYFIYDSYSCRVNKGTHFGIARVERFIRQCSKNNTKNSWVLKIDLKGYFMSIDRYLLLEKLFAFIDQHYKKSNKEFLKDLCKTIITNEPTDKCIFHSNFSAWETLPKDKSLFYSKQNCGLPIGNYTSQVFANFYLTEFDYFITRHCGIKYYGRYVDDCVLVHESKSVLKKLIPVLSTFLSEQLKLKLHPKKIYLQPVAHGVRFLGCFIKPTHSVANFRILNNFKASIIKHNKVAEKHKPTKNECSTFISSVNSYLGILKHYKTYFIRSSLLKNTISSFWFKQIAICGKSEKIVTKKYYYSQPKKKKF